jgi:hypothetical protein
MSATILYRSQYTYILSNLHSFQHVPGCAGGCRSLLDRHGNPALDHHSLLAVRIRRAVLHHSWAHFVHRSQPAIRSHRDAVGQHAAAASLRVGLGRSHLGPGVVVRRRHTVQEEVKSSCCGPAADRAGQVDRQVGRTTEVRFQCRCR